jgi:hypothetical protein
LDKPVERISGDAEQVFAHLPIAATATLRIIDLKITVVLFAPICK